MTRTFLSAIVTSALALGLAASAQAYPMFSNPQSVNLLERWNPDGTYALGVTATAGNAVRAIDFSHQGVGWNVNNPTALGTVTVRYTFDSPKTIDTVSVNFRPNHAPTNYTFQDQNGVIVTNNTDPAFLSDLYTHTVTPRTSDYIELVSNPAATSSNIWEINQIGAYLAPGEQLAIDGTYNVFYEESPTPTGFDDLGRWTDLTYIALSPSTTANFQTYNFANTYLFKGAYLNYQFRGNGNASLEGAQIEISRNAGLT